MINYLDQPFQPRIQLKRGADIFLSLVLLLISFPVLLLSIIWIKIDDFGPIFYKQIRTGWMGHPFVVLKLRTMREHKDDDEASWTKIGDQRITKPGQILRKFRIDELPQLLNVLKGEMSLIGPRPERPEMDLKLQQNIPHYQKDTGCVLV